MANEAPSVSVLVAAWNEAARIGPCLDSLRALSWPRLEILIAAGGNDGTDEVARRYEDDRVRVFAQRPGQGKQAALRELLAVAGGEVLYLTDGDCIVPEATFRAVLAPIARGEVEAVTGRYCPFDDDLASPLVLYRWGIQRAVERRRGPDSEGMTGANAAVTRRAVEAVGGFAAAVPTGTDYHLARQLRAVGIAIRYVDAAVQTEYARAARSYVQQQSRWVRNTLVLGRRFGDRSEVRASLTTIGLSLGVLGFPLTLPVTRRWGIAAWLGLVGFTARRRGQYAAAASAEVGRSLPLGFIVRLPYLCLLDFIAGAKPAVDLVRKDWRTKW